MEYYNQIQWIGYVVSAVSFSAAVLLFFCLKVPEKMKILLEKQMEDFIVIKSEVLVHTSERIKEESDEEGDEKSRGRTIDFKCFNNRSFETTKIGSTRV